MDVGAARHLPFVVRDVADVAERRLMGGVVDENVDATELIDGAPDDGPAMRGVLDVAFLPVSFPEPL